MPPSCFNTNSIIIFRKIYESFNRIWSNNSVRKYYFVSKLRLQSGHAWWRHTYIFQNSDVIMGPKASQITSLTIVYSIVYSGADQRKHQSSASVAFVQGIHRWPLNSPHKGPVTRKMFPIWWRHHISLVGSGLEQIPKLQSLSPGKSFQRPFMN